MAGERIGSNIEIDGVKETIDALKAFEPEIRKVLNKQIRQALKTVETTAQSLYPKGAWSITINNKRILGSIAARSGGSLGRSWGESSPGIRASIFEFAGKVQPGKTPQAQAMIRSLNDRYGTPGRFLWGAWDNVGEHVLDQIKTAVQNAERELQASLDAAGETY